MPRFVDPFPQFIKSSGAPNNGGFLKFYDTGTTSPKNVYSDTALSASIGNEIRLDSSGRVPAVFLSGGYNVVLTDKDGNELDSADPVGLDTDVTAFDLWLSTSSYSIGDVVSGSNDLNYQSLADSNLNNDPVSTPSLWEQFYFVAVWNTVQTYAAGQIAIASDDRQYISVVGSNSGNDPTLDDGTNWLLILRQTDEPSFGDVTIAKTNAQSKGIAFDNDTVQRWKMNFDASENLDLSRYDGSGVLVEAVINFDLSTGSSTFTAPVIVNDAVTLNSGALTVNDANVTFSQDGSAAGMDVNLSSDASQQILFAFQDAGVDRWILGQDTSNSFRLNRYNASGVIQGTVFEVVTGTDNLKLEGNLQFEATAQGVDCVATAGGTMGFDFPSLAANTENVSLELLASTNTSGTKLINVNQGDGTSTPTMQIDAETGTIHTCLDRISTDGVKLGKITLSTSAPSGGEDGDLWLRY